MMDEIKRYDYGECPVCGAKVTVVGGWRAVEKAFIYFAFCTNVYCNLHGPKRKDEDEAVRIWDRMVYAIQTDQLYNDTDKEVEKWKKKYKTEKEARETLVSEVNKVIWQLMAMRDVSSAWVSLFGGEDKP